MEKPAEPVKPAAVEMPAIWISKQRVGHDLLREETLGKAGYEDHVETQTTRERDRRNEYAPVPVPGRRNGNFREASASAVLPNRTAHKKKAKHKARKHKKHKKHKKSAKARRAPVFTG